MVRQDRPFLQGTLDVLILKTLSWGPMHGYGVSSWLEKRTDDVLQIEDGSLYPALHRLEARGLIEAEWRRTPNNRRAKFYQITADGRAKLASSESEWSRFVEAVAKVLDGSEAPAWAS